MVPKPTDSVEIPVGITVTLSGPVNIYSPGGLDVAGTLNLTLATGPGAIPTCGIFMNDYPSSPGTNLTVDSGGIINMDLTGYPDANVHGIDANGQAGITNNGTINLTCHKTTSPGGYAGLSYGLVITDPTSQMVNGGTINILKSAAHSDGNGACFGIYVRGGGFVNQAAGVIMSTVNANGVVRVDAGSFTNQGTLTNFGFIENSGGTITNTGTLVHVFPNADYQGNGGIQGAGTLGLAGTVAVPWSLDLVAQIYQSPTKAFSVASGTALILNAALKIPAGYTLAWRGAVQQAAQLENNGTIRFFFPSAVAPNVATITGRGQFTITGNLAISTTVDLSQYGGKNYHIQLNDTFTVPSKAILTIPSGVTLTLDNWGTLDLQDGGTLRVKGTVQNDHEIKNNGLIQYVLPNAVYEPGTGAGAGTISGAGMASFSGQTTSPLNLASYGVKECLVEGVETLTASGAFTVPADYTLAIRGTLILGGLLTNNGTVTNSGTLQYSFPGAAITGQAISGSGIFGLKGALSAAVTLANYGSPSYQITTGNYLDVEGPSGFLTIPSGTTLTIAGTLNLRSNGVASNAGSIALSGAITNTGGTLTHVFPSASFSKAATGTITAGLAIALEGSVTSATSLGALGYGVSVYNLLTSRTVSLSATLTVPAGVTLSNAGTISGTGAVSIAGVLKHVFPTATFTATASGAGTFAILGSIQSAVSLGSIGYSNRGFAVQAGDTLQVETSSSLTVPSQCYIGNAGSLSNSGTLTLGDHPSNTNAALGNTGSFSNYGTVTIANTVAQSCGIFNSGGSASFYNSGSIALNNTNGVGVRFFSMTNHAENTGTMTVNTAYAATACNIEAAAISNNSFLDNTGGTIAASATVNSVWNTGTICGGTYTGRNAITSAQKVSCPL